MGSFIAQAIADKAPGRVRSMVLMASAPTLDNAVVRELSTVVESLTDPVARAFIREFQYSTVAAPVPAEFMDQAIANSARVPARVWQALMRGFLEYRPAVTRPRVRTLVLGGKKDTVFSAAEQTALARLFPDGRLQLFDHIGHALHWEEPETFVSALLRFLKTK
jgi:pimeloyl-ACP methyl ester carboxylesterase